jgi:TonB family protein
MRSLGFVLVCLCATSTLSIGCGPEPTAKQPDTSTNATSSGGTTPTPSATTPTTASSSSSAPTPTGATSTSVAPATSSTSSDTPLVGSLSNAEIQKAINDNIQAFDACYTLGADKQGKLEGTVTIKATVGPLGTVKEATVVKSTMKNTKVDKCVADAFKKVKFPQPKGGAVIITYPMTFGGEVVVKQPK